ncbi:hypothetical protein EV421DRAFT_1900595 [Armillaria borealis]|uniref:Uncharacterized protein n=1 Tax=Armillaria borealis TaxID=47425 RepID=A0AA39JU36_9AGAR|nr:hypothetical protein EV421DRAFT_1900595 [Armillaria borealis]
MEPKTKREAELLAALHISEQTNQIYQWKMIELQATNILNEAYCKTLHFFYERVVEFEEEQQRKQREKEERQMGKEERKKALTVWEEKVVKRQKIVDARRAEWERKKQEYVAAKLKWTSDKKKDKVKG